MLFPAKATVSHQKVRGGYYTPTPIVEHLVRWAIRTGSEVVLEPSAGDGAFVEQLATTLNAKGELTIVELLSEELCKATNKWRDRQGVAIYEAHAENFFRFYERTFARYDVVVGNPPFIRFQHFKRDERDLAFGQLRDLGYKPNGLANVWASFVQLSANILREGGRLAFVLPAELLQVGYAEELRLALPKMFDDVLIVGFDDLVFPDIQQEVVLLLAEGRRRDGVEGRLHTIQVKDGSALSDINWAKLAISHTAQKHSRPGMKWTSLFLPDDEFRCLDEIESSSGVSKLGDYATVDVGVVTGRNSFFVVDVNKANELQLNGSAVPSVGRTNALKSIFFSQLDLLNYEENYPSRMISLRGYSPEDFSPELSEYIRVGEEEGVHEGYKCRIRPRWFDVPEPYRPDAFMFRQIHNAPFVVANHASATATDTIHRVRTKQGINVDYLSAASINSLSFAWAEVCGRSYGGGVLELEPREAEQIPSLYQYAHKLDLAYIDVCLRNDELDSVLKHTDQVLLRQGLGLGVSDVARINNAWKRLKGRRQRRR